MKKHFALFTVLAAFTVNGMAQNIKGTYAIQNVQTGMYLRIKDANSKDGTPIVAYSPVNWKCVTWDFQQQDGQTYALVNLFSRKTMQPKGDAANGVSLEERPVAASSASQQYEFIPVEKGTYMIRFKGTELYVTPADEQGAENTATILAPKRNSKLQYWTLHEQHPTM